MIGERKCTTFMKLQFERSFLKSNFNQSAMMWEYFAADGTGLGIEI